LIGKTLGHYQIVALIGRGGMGEVYRAHDTKLDRDVALKILPAEMATDPARLERFEREAKTVAGLNHPHIVTLHSVEEESGLRFLTMELVEGRSLDELLTAEGLPLAKVFEIGIAVADALAAAHERGIIHRDLKPANVMLTHDGRVKVLDFGLAKLTEDPRTTSQQAATTIAPITADGVVVGTAPYMSPEQLRGKDVDFRSDLFSLGILLYELATGKRPFDGETNADVISSILKETPPAVTHLKPDLPRHLGRIVTQCLEKDPRDRFHSAIDIRNQLRMLRRESESTPVHLSDVNAAVGENTLSSPRSDTAKAVKRSIAPLVIAASAVIVIATIALFLSRDERSETPGSSRPSTTATEGSEDPARNSIAVLPFVNMSSEKEQEYFSDGLTEELLSALAKIPDLKVAGRTSSFSFKGKNEDLRTIASKLGVAHLLEGSVRKAGNQLRITVQLVKAEDGFRLWSENYERTLDDIFAVQDDIAGSVAKALELTLLGKEAAAKRPDASAYDMVLQARFVMNVRTEDAVRRAREILNRALEISPDYAPAWAEMGLLYRRELEMSTSIEDAQRLNRQVKSALERALELDPDLAEAHSRMAGVLLEEWDFEGAVGATERALAADPKSPIVLGNAAVVYMDLGRWEEANRLAAKAANIDPISHSAHSAVSDAARLSGRFDDAERALARAAELAPTSPMVHYRAGTIHLLRGDAPAAKTSFDRFNELAQFGDYGRLFASAMIEHTAGNETASAAAAREFEDVFGDEDPASCAQIRAWRGEIDLAFEWLQRALAVRDGFLCEIKTDPFLAALHDDPRWDDLLREIGLPASR
jgi:serine/threonine protein kinase/Tfp pilus assembly protein PilF